VVGEARRGLPHERTLARIAIPTATEYAEKAMSRGHRRAQPPARSRPQGGVLVLSELARAGGCLWSD